MRASVIDEARVRAGGYCKQAPVLMLQPTRRRLSLRLGLSLRIAVFLALGWLLTGCASSVRTQLNTFMAPGTAFGEGTVAVQPANESLRDSLEFDLYKAKLENRLQGVGYALAVPEEADYIARLGYSVDEVQSSARQPEVVFTTGFGRFYRHGGVGFTFGDGRDYEPEYVRRVSLTITRTPASPGASPQRVYETTAMSGGSCPVLSVVFDEMLAAIFQEFPGENGAVRTVTVRGEADCQ